MSIWFFVSDLHGQLPRYRKLFRAILTDKPSAVLLGGDLLPSAFATHNDMPEGNFIRGVIQTGFAEIKSRLQGAYPQIMLIPGNDDPRSEEVFLVEGESQGLWHYIHNRMASCDGFSVYGYACVPPTPFMLKDWERYDVSHYIEPGCIPLEEGWRSISIPIDETPNTTILSDIEKLALNADFSKSIFLFHAPPYQTTLDRAALDGKTIDGVPFDVHIGSIAIRRFIEAKQPWITLHGHVHESARLTGSWRDQFNRTFSFSAAHDGSEMALVRFDPAEPEKVSRELI